MPPTFKDYEYDDRDYYGTNVEKEPDEDEDDDIETCNTCNGAGCDECNGEGYFDFSEPDGTN